MLGFLRKYGRARFAVAHSLVVSLRSESVGRYAGNTLRDLNKKLGAAPLHEAAHRFRTPMKAELCGLHTTEREQTLLLPHVVFAVMHRDYPSEFKKKLLGPPAALEKFWSEMVVVDSGFALSWRHRTKPGYSQSLPEPPRTSQSFLEPPRAPRSFWEALGGSGRLWEDLGGSGRLWEALGGSWFCSVSPG